MAWLYGMGRSNIVALRGSGAALGVLYGVGQSGSFQRHPAHG